MEKIYYGSLATALLGKVFVASTEKGVCRVDFHLSEGEFVRELKKSFRGEIVKEDRRNHRATAEIREYLAGKRKRFDCPVDLKGTPFQKKVWAALARIPCGSTSSYKEIAEAIGHPKAYRAVGNANGANPVPILIPCHRVIENNGGLGGYGQGLPFKKRLLEFEKKHGV